MEDSQEQRIFHIPVLVDSVLTFLITKLSGVYVDCTIGGGGHGEAVLKRLSDDGKLVGMDRDEEAIAFCAHRFSPYGDRVQLIRGEVGDVDLLLADAGFDRVDGFLLDLGVSSYQIDTAERGFSYLMDAPLDMRMDRSSARCAMDVINDYSEEELARVFWEYGEERLARPIARRIVEARKRSKIETTGMLADVVQRAAPHRFRTKTLSRIFQAIRYEVNEEIEQLRTGLEKMVSFLRTGGRIVVISWESLTDRMVKRFFRGEEATFSSREEPMASGSVRFDVLTRRVVRPSEEEISRNPRARSARLRAAEMR
jgi:16S rRNA (cytosine1402-N4)-methyltransferase